MTSDLFIFLEQNKNLDGIVLVTLRLPKNLAPKHIPRVF